MEDAKSANLMKKNNLISLSLSWKNDITEDHAEHFEEVLHGLEPSSNLEVICIKSYGGSKFPNWMVTLALKNLNEVTLENCRRCEHLPPLGKLHSLTSLNLRGMDSIKILDPGWHGDGDSFFPALTSLKLSTMPNFEEWTLADSVESFPCLTRLEISSCPKLNGLPKLPALTSFMLFHGSLELVRAVMFLTSLTSLTLFGSDEILDNFPEGLLQNHNALEDLQIGSLAIRTLSNVLDNLFALRTLSLDSCYNLETLTEVLKNLESLERLDIRSCDGLASFPAKILEDLPLLRALSFQNCKKLKPLAGSLKQAPKNLHDLLINGLPELEYLPESIQILSSMRELGIWRCEGLCSLPNWLSGIESLSLIKIWNCKKLYSLPDDFKNLKSVRKLDIRYCPKLEKRCKKTKGEDWQRISHIPIICINDEVIQHLDQ